MKQYDFILLDFDGTICDLQVDWTALKQAVFDTFNSEFHFKEKRLMPMVNQLLSEGNHLNQLFSIIKSFEQPNGNVKYHNVNRNIMKLGRPFFVISNNLNSTVKRVLIELDLFENCIEIIGVDNVTKSKPDRNPYEILKQKHKQIDSKSAVYIGNTEIDAIFANNCKIKYIDILNL